MSARDKILAMLLPAILVLGVYGLFFLQRKVSERTRVEKSMMDAKAKAPSPAQLAVQKNELFKVKMETDAIDAQLMRLKEKWIYEIEFCKPGAHRHDRVEKLTKLFNKHNLTSMEDAEVEGGAQSSKISPSQESVVQKIAQLSSAQKPQLRRIRFHGRFVDVHRVLDELATGEALALPVGLTMKTNGDLHRREWTLLIWL